MKLHTLIAVMLLAASATFADTMAPSVITTNQFSYDEKWEQPVTLTNVLVTYHPDIANNEFKLVLTPTNGVTSTNLLSTGIFDINPNILTDDITVKLLRKPRGPNGVWVPTTQFTYEWNIPEPATIGLILSGGFALMIVRRFKKV